MAVTEKMKELLAGGAYAETFAYLYPGEDAPAFQAQRYANAVDQFSSIFQASREVELFSAPGRTEIGGNHTDHQHGRVLAAGVNLDVIAAASKNDENIIRIKSEGYPMDTIELSVLEPVASENNHAAALIRGVAARMKMLGYNIGGFDAYTTSNVLKGSGLSSSAAFEVLVGTILNHFYNNGIIDAVKIAQIGQYAENQFFGKPCGLMDQTASSVGGFVTIDFQDTEHPVVEKVEFDFAHSGYTLCIVDTGGNHADLTPDYASIPQEMRSVAAEFGKEILRDVDEKEFRRSVGALRAKGISDRAILRAIHFFADNERVVSQVAALRDDNFDEFKRLIVESGRSSYMYLQNVFSCINPAEQGIALALALTESMLEGKGAWRVHGGGFAGTMQAFVPLELLEDYKAMIEAAMGEGKCHVLSIRPVGGIKVEA